MNKIEIEQLALVTGGRVCGPGRIQVGDDFGSGGTCATPKRAALLVCGKGYTLDSEGCHKISTPKRP